MGVEEECTLHPITDTIINLIAGAAGGVACVLSGQPFEAVKVKMLRDLPAGLTSGWQQRISVLALSSPPSPHSPCVWLRAYKMQSGLFVCYCVLLLFLFNALSGSLASVLSSLVLCPTDCEMRMVGKTPLASHISTWSVARDILKTDGPQGLFQGMTSTWLREVPGYFLFFGGYEICRIRYHEAVVPRVPALYCGLTPTVLRAFSSNGALILAYEWTRRTLINHTSTA
uniref:Uncharacterized protein n=1 Tax=Oncorhynchus mykiss TaxID=8022 RepID=A0A8C7UWI9_ONCMY